MAILTAAEFGKVFKVSVQRISLDISKKEIHYVDGTKLIDVSDFRNRTWINTRISSGRVNVDLARTFGFLDLEGVKEKGAKRKTVSKLAGKKPSPVEDIKISLSDGTEVSTLDLDVKKKQLDNEKKEIDIRVKKLEEQRLEGKLIPTEAVQALISQLSRSFIKTYSEGAESFTTDFAHRNKLNIQASANLKGGLTKMINKAHDDAITNAKNNLVKMVQEIKDSLK